MSNFCDIQIKKEDTLKACKEPDIGYVSLNSFLKEQCGCGEETTNLADGEVYDFDEVQLPFPQNRFAVMVDDGSGTMVKKFVPIYTKMIEFEINSQGKADVLYDTLDVDKLLETKAILQSEDGMWLNEGQEWGSNSSFKELVVWNVEDAPYVAIYSREIEINTSISPLNVGQIGYITLKYTKTTDTPVVV